MKQKLPARADLTRSTPTTNTVPPRFERPRVRPLGALPAVTAAFGGSFTP